MSRRGVSNNESKFVCYKCGETGHLSQNCMTPDTKCFSCGDSGHISTQCPKKIKGKVKKIRGLPRSGAAKYLKRVKVGIRSYQLLSIQVVPNV